MVKYVCPKCGKDVGTYSKFCCGYMVQTPKGAAAEWSAFKVILLVIGLPLLLIPLIFGGSIIVGGIRDSRDQTRAIDTGVALPITVTNTTVIISSGNVTHYITPDGEFRAITRGEVSVIDTNVRSIELVGNTTFYIKNDNSLWGFGSNAQGALGTGSGVDAEEPVLIMENVAKLHRGSHVYALTTDGVLWVWGVGDFSPVRMTEDVVAFREGVTSAIPTIQRSNGLLYRFRHSNVPASEGEFFRINPFAILDFVGASGNALTDGRTILFYINGDNTLTRLAAPRGSSRRVRTEISQDVQFLWGWLSPPAEYNLHMINSEGTLWGFGVNRNGELGDGTRVPRQENPIRIADNVVDAGWYYYLTADGELWIWDSENPTPEKILDNVATVFTSLSSGRREFDGAILFNDGTMKTNFRIWRLEQEGRTVVGASNRWHEDIKIPQTIVFE